VKFILLSIPVFLYSILNMPLIQALVLGLIQGLTEFIPVSSSGHLVLVRELFGWEDLGVAFDTILHLGTLLAVVVYFWSTWKKVFRTLGVIVASLFKPELRQSLDKEDVFLLGALVIGTIPAVVTGYFLGSWIDDTFRSLAWVTVFLMATGILFIIVERARRYFKRREEERGQPEFGTTKFAHLGWWKVLFIGCMQAVALLPGISRSGTTIAGGVFSGLNREAAARFAFLLSFPVILAAGIVGISQIAGDGVEKIGWGSLIIGFVVSAVSGYFAVRLMLKYLRTKKLYIFSIYLFVLAIIIFILGS